jgi:hypothetical protein
MVSWPYQQDFAAKAGARQRLREARLMDRLHARAQYPITTNGRMNSGLALQSATAD